MLDIRPFKVAHFSEKVYLGVKVPGVGYVYRLPSITPENTCDGTNKWDTKYKTGASYFYSDKCVSNYWAGAKADCAAAGGMHLPNIAQLKTIRDKALAEPSLGLPTYGNFWSSSDHSADGARGFRFDLENGENGVVKFDSNMQALCVGD